MTHLDYTWEKREQMIRKEEFEEGMERGVEQGRAEERSLLFTLISKMTAGGDGDKIVQLENPEVLEAMQRKYGLDFEKLQDLGKKF